MISDLNQLFSHLGQILFASCTICFPEFYKSCAQKIKSNKAYSLRDIPDPMAMNQQQVKGKGQWHLQWQGAPPHLSISVHLFQHLSMLDYPTQRKAFPGKLKKTDFHLDLSNGSVVLLQIYRSNRWTVHTTLRDQDSPEVLLFLEKQSTEDLPTPVIRQELYLSVLFPTFSAEVNMAFVFPGRE